MRILGLAVLLLVAACKQGLGDRCQLRRDCAPGLECVLPMGGTCLNGGTCQPEGDERPCHGNSDCPPGLACQKSADCTDEGQLVCTHVDMSTPQDLEGASTDALPND